MPASVYHALSMTTPDDPLYENQPQHWNSGHNVTLNVLATEISGLFSNANGVSFGLDGTNITGSVQTNYQAPGAYLTTAALSQDSSKYAGINGAITGGSITVNTSGVSVNLPAYLTTAQPPGTYLTTAMASNRGSDFVQATAAFAGTNASGTINSTGISVSVGNYITTAMASNRGTDFVQAAAAFAGTSASGTIASGGISVSIGPYITTAALSNHSHGNPTLALTNLSGTTASASDGFTLSLSAGAPGGAATYSINFEPFHLVGGTATSTASLSQLHLMPVSLPVNLSFGQINLIGSGAILNTGVVGTWSFRLTNVQSIAYSAVYTISNTNFLDIFLFSRGSGGYSSEIETFASTRNSFITIQSMTFGGTANHTAGSTGSQTARQSQSMLVSYPMVTSGTMTSVNAASTFTTWGTGYTTWNSTASTSVTNTYNTTTTGSTSIASTMAGTTAWASNKMIPLHFATSLSAGQYWVGMVRYSSTSSSSTFGSTITAAGTGASYTVTFNASALTRTGEITWVGATNTIANSLGWLGFASQGSMAPTPAMGSFSGTWASNTTYLNNAGNPAGAIADTQILSNVSFFRTWMGFASKDI